MNKQSISLVTFWSAITCIALLCIFMQSNYLVNGNISWLLIGAQRLLDGQSMSGHIYENNPPLSLIIYIPHVLFSWLIDKPLPTASFYVTFFFTALSTITMNSIVKKFGFLGKEQVMAFVACYFISITLITTVFFSERDHFVIMGLAPFMLCQFALMQKINIPKALLYTVFAVGTLCILIKPQYGLAPTVFLIIRLIKDRKFNIIKEPDFLALAIGTLLYLSVLMIFFRDYVYIIFPNVVSLYITKGNSLSDVMVATKLHALTYICIFVIEIFREDLKKEQKALVLFIYTCCLLCLIPYYVQLKGYYYHLLPSYGFFVIGLSLSLTFRMDKLAKKFKALTMIIPFICVLFITNAYSPLNNKFPTRKSLIELPVAQLIKKECKEPCTIFLFHGDMEIFLPTIALMEYEFGSRFASLWFLPGLLQNLDSDIPRIKEKAGIDKKKYLDMIYEDFKYYSPDLLIISKELPVGNEGRPFDFIRFIKEKPDLSEYFDKNYEKTSDFEFDRQQYFTGTTLEYPFTLYYNIYKKRANIQQLNH